MYEELSKIIRDDAEKKNCLTDEELTPSEAIQKTTKRTSKVVYGDDKIFMHSEIYNTENDILNDKDSKNQNFNAASEKSPYSNETISEKRSNSPDETQLLGREAQSNRLYIENLSINDLIAHQKGLKYKIDAIEAESKIEITNLSAKINEIDIRTRQDIRSYFFMFFAFSVLTILVISITSAFLFVNLKSDVHYILNKQWNENNQQIQKKGL